MMGLQEGLCSLFLWMNSLNVNFQTCGIWIIPRRLLFHSCCYIAVSKFLWRYLSTRNFLSKFSIHDFKRTPTTSLYTVRRIARKCSSLSQDDLELTLSFTFFEPSLNKKKTIVITLAFESKDSQPWDIIKWNRLSPHNRASELGEINQAVLCFASYSSLNLDY